MASTAVTVRRSTPAPAGELHAFFNGATTTLCRLKLAELNAFPTMRWSARPIGLPVCKRCFALAQ